MCLLMQSIYEKGTRDEMDEFVFQLLDLTDDGLVGRYDVWLLAVRMMVEVGHPCSGIIFADFGAKLIVLDFDKYDIMFGCGM